MASARRAKSSGSSKPPKLTVKRGSSQRRTLRVRKPGALKQALVPALKHDLIRSEFLLLIAPIGPGKLSFAADQPDENHP